jgi:hypothetical protein
MVCYRDSFTFLSVNTTKVVVQSINTQIKCYFLPLYVSALMGPSSGSIMIVRVKLFELPNMDPHLVQHVHIITVMPKLKCKNYNINVINMLTRRPRFKTGSSHVDFVVYKVV